MVMNEAVAQLLSRYRPVTTQDYKQALREILQDVALLGLWRSNFFDRAAFYGGTALRILYGLDRFSEDLDFSLLTPDPDFDLSRYTASLEREVRAFGFDVTCEVRAAGETRAVRSAFLKADTVQQLLTIEARPDVIAGIPKGQLTKIKLEVDTDPPPGFETEVRFLLRPVPFSVRTYSLPDLFAGKMHALLCRKWVNRVKGRDWYDLVWFAANHPELRLSHLEHRMRQSEHWKASGPLGGSDLKRLLDETIDALNVEQARREVEPFVRDPAALQMWSSGFFRDVAGRLLFV
jgi:predicted nucleotidyltransferase component of viral defense system